MVVGSSATYFLSFPVYIARFHTPFYLKAYKILSRLVTRPTKWLCAQRRLRSAWASAQSDQSLRCPHSFSSLYIFIIPHYTYSFFLIIHIHYSSLCIFIIAHYAYSLLLIIHIHCCSLYIFIIPHYTYSLFLSMHFHYCSLCIFIIPHYTYSLFLSMHFHYCSLCIFIIAHYAYSFFLIIHIHYSLQWFDT